MLFAVGAALNAPITTERFIHEILPSLWDRFFDLVASPVQFPSMLWITLPLLITLFMMEFYFGRYLREELGWNTAVANSLVLVFVSVDLIRQVYSGTSGILETFAINKARTLISVIVGFSGLLLFYWDFFHILPKWFAFKVSSPLAVNFTAYLSIVAVYTKMKLDFYTLVAALALFLLLFFLFYWIHWFEPKVGIKRSTVDRLLGRILAPLERGYKRKKAKRK